MASQTKTSSGSPQLRCLELDAGIYRKPALLRAAERFAHLADFEFQRKGKTWSIRMRIHEPRLAERMADEFANHALAAQVNRW